METVHKPVTRQIAPATPLARWVALLLHPLGWPLLLVLLLGLVVGGLAYQAPPRGEVRVGWLGDQLFLNSSAGLGAEHVQQGALYPDDLTPDSPTGRSRWTRQHARMVIPNLGAGTSLHLTLLVQGWPADVRDPPLTGTRTGADTADGTVQPVVTVQADGQPIGMFTPASTWERYEFTVPARLRSGADLVLTLDSSATFADTLRGSDPRPKGVRLAALQVQTAAHNPYALHPPAWRAVGMLVLVLLLFYLLLLRLLHAPPLCFLLSTVVAGAAGAGLTLARIWMGMVLVVGLWLLAVALLIVWSRPLLWYLRQLLRRYAQGWSLNYALITVALVWLGYVIGRTVHHWRTNQPDMGWLQSMFPDSLLIGLLSVGGVALILVQGREGLPRLAHSLVTFIGSRTTAPILLLILGGLWLGYELVVISMLPYVGHADYADNAVVARNLVHGRGWVVDYISQFYVLYPDTTRPQETWPLLQPVWMAPFLALFGPHAWAAKIPNLLFNAALLVLIYQIGTRLWDRRVGLVAALVTLTNHLFFNLTIYTTSDLGFVVFCTAALYTLYLALPTHAQRSLPASPVFVPRLLLLSGLLVGLMMLQKPSGATIAFGMGLWLGCSLLHHSVLPHLRQRAWGRTLAGIRRVLVWGGVWTAVALLVLSPYLARNMALFGAPVYSTEQYDAWVLGYRGDSGEAWHDIYRVFTPELDGPGLPDRSWILRWGFDYTYAKFRTQVQAVRDYLLPAWPGLPTALVGEDNHWWLLSRNEAKNLLTPAGAWLSLLGIIAALRARWRLLSLLLLSFAPYTLFLLTYWRTNEERYFLMAMPWLALFAAWMIWAGYDRLAAIGDRRWSPLAFILVGVAIVSILRPSWPMIATKVQVEPQQWAPDIIAYEWLQTNTDPDAVMMTRNPWQLNWHAERPAVMIPNTASEETLRYLARHYEAEYLVLETLQRVKGDGARTLAPLITAADAQVGDVIDGFTVVYASPTPNNRVLIYRFPAADSDSDDTASQPLAPPQQE